jgi:protein YibB
MGLDKTSIEAIFISQGWDIPKKKMLMLGRQAIHTSSDVLYFLGNKYGFSFTDNVFSIQEYVKELERYEYFSENLFKELGFDSVESLDNSDYECPTHIQNMNLPLNPELKGKFSFVFDGGTTEHVFNSVQCYQNIIDLLEVGGIFLSVTCNNNFSGHGFYQFSPEFFISCFREEYGMELLDLHIAKNNSTKEEWVRVNSLDDQPAKRNTTKIHGAEETYIITIARKISEGKRLISHPPNQYSYSYKKDITQEQNQEMTITTAFFDVGRGNWKGYNRSLEEYKEYSKNMLSLDCNMVIYTTSDLVDHFLESRKKIDPSFSKTKIVQVPLNEIPYYDYLEKITRLMSDDFFIQNIKNRHPDKLRPEVNYPIYNIVQFAKSKFVEQTIRSNPFNTDYHCWMDAGIYQGRFPKEFIGMKFPNKKVEVLGDGKIHQFYRVFPKDRDINKISYYSEIDDVRIVGAWFGGNKKSLIEYARIINKVIDDSVEEGVISDDQNIYTICYLENKDIFNLHDGSFARDPYFAGLDYFI